MKPIKKNSNDNMNKIVNTHSTPGSGITKKEVKPSSFRVGHPIKNEKALK